MIPDQVSVPTPVEFDVCVVAEAGQPVVVVRGEIDLATAIALEVALGEAMAAGTRITLDLRDASFIDSTGVMTLVAAHHRLGQIPEAIVLRDPTPLVRRVIAAAGIEHLFTLQCSPSSGGRPPLTPGRERYT